MSDELPTAARVSDPGIRALYRQENRWQAWLGVEAALAKAQAELGIIPQQAADAIARAARLNCSTGHESTKVSRAPATPSYRWFGSSAEPPANRMGGGCIGERRRRILRRPGTLWCCVKLIGSSFA